LRRIMVSIHMEIAIIGCGIGGLAAGALLAGAGHDITVFEKFEQPEPVGSGLVVQPVGLAVLETIGAAEYALSKGQKIIHMQGQEVKSGHNVLDVSYGTRFGLAIHRASLFEALYHAAIGAGVKVITSTEITNTELSSNKRLVNGIGFDLVIDASGAGSVLSAMPRKPLQFGALWATVNWPETSLPIDYLSQKYRAAKNMIGVLPVGSLPNETGAKATIFWSLPQNEFEAWRKQPLEDWKSEASNLWPEMAPFLDQITKHDNMTTAFYSHGTLKKPFSKRLVHIGDSAHAASPQLGQGANMALLDAQALARALAQFPLQTALQKYARSRLRHVRAYQLMSAVFTPMYQSNSRLLPFLRNRFFAPLTRIPPAPRVLTKLVCGDMIKPIRGFK